MNRLRSLRCVVNGEEWAGSPRRPAPIYIPAHTSPVIKEEIGEGESERERMHTVGFFFSFAAGRMKARVGQW